MITLMALEPVTYDGIEHAAGALFEVYSESDARVLTVLRKARAPEPADSPELPPDDRRKGGARRRKDDAEAQPDLSYGRRDLRAEE
jgi:hypothetical protein